MRNLGILFDRGEVDSKIISNFESTIGFNLPVSYKTLIGKHNMLYPIENSFDFQLDDETHRMAFMFCGYGNVPYEKIENAQIIDISGYSSLITIGNCANGDKVCFDYRNNPSDCNPPVVVVLHDWWVEGEDGIERMLVCDVAKDFEAFVNLLYKFEV